MNQIEEEVKKIYGKLRQEKPGIRAWFRKGGIKRLMIGMGVLLIIGYQIGTIYWYNTDIHELEDIAAEISQIEKEYKRRDDLIPNLMSISKDYARHEQDLFQYVSEARALLEPAQKTGSASASLKNAEMERILSKLVALSEQYPELKAVQSYEDLMEMIATTENRIASIWDKYIDVCQSFNSCNQAFWCYFFTFYIPMPNYVEYYHAEKSQMPLNCGRWQFIKDEDNLNEKYVGKSAGKWIKEWRAKNIRKVM